MSYQANIIDSTAQNEFFRKVIYTGTKSQLVVMTIPVNGEIGEEIHKNVEQLFFIISGEGKVMLDGSETPLLKGEILVVNPGTKHNIINTSNEPLKLYTVYVPPNHIDGRVHETKEDASEDKEDEKFSENVE